MKITQFARWAGLSDRASRRLSCAAALALLTLSQATAQVNSIETAVPNDISDQRSNAWALTNATVVVRPGERRDNATLLIREGRVVGVERGNTVPAGYVEMDMSGRFIYPGLIELDSSYGLPEPAERAAFSFNSPEVMSAQTTGAYSPNDAIRSQHRAAEHFKADNKAAKKLREAGFSAALTHHHDGIARGTGALVLLGDSDDNQLVVDANASAHYSLDKGSSKQSYPISIMGSMALLRQTYLDAAWYAKQTPKPFTDQSLDGWLSTQQLPQFFDARRNWLTTLRADKVGDEFDVQYVIRTAGDSYQRLDAIKSTRAALVVPLDFPEAPKVSDPYRADQVSTATLKHWELAPTNPARLATADIEFALTGADNKSFWPNLRKAIKHGLSEQDALAALTTIPAKLLRQDRLGSLGAGSIANFLVTSGELFDADTVMEENWIGGQRFQLKPHAEDHAGFYQLSVGDRAFPLTVSGKPGTHSAKLAEPKQKSAMADGSKTTVDLTSEGFEADAEQDGSGQSKAITVKLTIDGQRVTLSFTPAGDTAPIRLSGWIGTTGWQGRGQLGDGRWVDWVAKRPQADFADTREEASETAQPTDSESDSVLGKVTYPFAAYGRTDAPQQETLLFRGATVWTNEDEGILSNTDVLVRNGKIARIGQNLPSGNARIIEAAGLHLTAGIIDEHSHIALNSVNDVAVNSGMVRMGDVINSEDVNIYRNLAGGVTAAQLLHGSANPIGGQSALIKMRWGSTPEEMKIAGADGFIKFALGENVKRSANSQSVRYPQTRMGVEQVYRDTFARARDYAADRDRNKRRDLALDAMVEILNQQRFISCHSYVQSEINMLMKVAEDFDFNVSTFTHILEGYKVADKMAAHGVGGSTFADWWAYKWEVRYAIPYNPALMAQAGVTVAINSDSAEMSRRLNQEAAKSVKYGDMSEEDAWKMVTLNPAKLLRLDDRMGSIKVGKDADLVLWTDNPLSIYSQADTTLVDGKVMFSRETDRLARENLRSERARLIAKALAGEGNGGGGGSGKDRRMASAVAVEQQWHCDSLHGFEYLSELHAH